MRPEEARTQDILTPVMAASLANQKPAGVSWRLRISEISAGTSVEENQALADAKVNWVEYIDQIYLEELKLRLNR